ncbi:MAG: HNH endonuclease [Actinobacteria bacterium]|nr:HNH endonuclease [Actinomycetota bacterium]
MQPNAFQVLDRSVATMRSAYVDLLSVVPDINRSKAWVLDGATSMSAWLAARYAIPKATAREWVRVSHALEELPEINAAFASGRLSWEQLRPLTAFATAATDAQWARIAPEWRVCDLVREAERQRKVKAREDASARTSRYLEIRKDPDLPRFYLDGMLPAEEGAAVKAALEKRAQEVVLADEPGCRAEARMADALVELVTEQAAGSPPEAVIVVHVDQASLEGSHRTAAGAALAETESGTRLGPQAVRRMACDAKVEWVLQRDGRAVGIGRRSRHIPPRLLRLLRFRDGGMCRFPGCERRSWLKAHHIVHWSDGGPTDLDNLVLLCYAHHRLLHEGRWRTSGHPAGRLRFHDPGGRVLERPQLEVEAVPA